MVCMLDALLDLLFNDIAFEIDLGDLQVVVDATIAKVFVQVVCSGCDLFHSLFDTCGVKYAVVRVGSREHTAGKSAQKDKKEARNMHGGWIICGIRLICEEVCCC